MHGLVLCVYRKRRVLFMHSFESKHVSVRMYVTCVCFDKQLLNPVLIQPHTAVSV